MWEQIGLQVVLTVASVVASSIATYFVAMYKAKYEAEKKKQAERDEKLDKAIKALQLIMYRYLKTDAKTYLNDNFLSAEEAVEFDEFLGCYEDLGKNGRIDNLAQRVRSLPIKDKTNA